MLRVISSSALNCRKKLNPSLSAMGSKVPWGRLVDLLIPKTDKSFVLPLLCISSKPSFSRWIGLVGTPLLLSPILFLASDSPPARCAYVVRSLLWSDFKIYFSSSWFLWWQSTGPWSCSPSLSPLFSLWSSSLSLAWLTPTPLPWFTWRLLLQQWTSISCWIVEQMLHHNVVHTQGVQMMYIGSLMVALAVEESGLHRRIALNALSLAVKISENCCQPLFYCLIFCSKEKWMMSLW